MLTTKEGDNRHPAFRSFISRNTSINSRKMKTILSVFLLSISLQTAVAQSSGKTSHEQAKCGADSGQVAGKYTDHYYARYRQFADEPPVTSKDIVMLGNSLTENGGDWSARLGRKHVINRGIIGDEVMGVYDRLHQILPGKPARLFLLIGVNDVSHDLTADSIAGMIRMTVERIRRESPGTKLYLQSLLPINESFGRYKRMTGKTDTIPAINAKLRALAKEKKITYVDLFPRFIEKGTNILRKELTNDGLHLNEEGYAIWVKRLKRVW